jgi:CheY-like chemotaxis protein
MPKRSPRRKPCILIVDDDPEIRESLCDTIASWRCVALAAASGREALAILGRRRVDVALCDLAMPGMDGADTLREIRQRLPALPVLMMSVTMSPDLRRHLCDIGAQSCLAKPRDRKGLALVLFPWCFPASQKASRATETSP